MPVTPARWSIVVSQSTDQTLRQFLAAHGGGRKGDLSRFVEEAVQARILELSAQQAKATNARQTPESVATAIEESLQWARRR